jgi:hypothetical protein
MAGRADIPSLPALTVAVNMASSFVTLANPLFCETDYRRNDDLEGTAATIDLARAACDFGCSDCP